MEEVHYCNDPGKVRVFEGVPKALQALRAAGFRTVLVTNQNGIAKGLISQNQYESVHTRLLEQLGPDTLDAAYMCADPAGQPSERRKPAPGMLLEATQDLRLDLGRSWIIGDKAIDIACGKNAGIPGILVRTGYGRAEEREAGAAWVAETFAEAVNWLLERRA